jgi:hypothetical protein
MPYELCLAVQARYTYNCDSHGFMDLVVCFGRTGDFCAKISTTGGEYSFAAIALENRLDNFRPDTEHYIPRGETDQELSTTAIRQTVSQTAQRLDDELGEEQDMFAIAFPFQFLALASSKEGELVLTRFGFHCFQKVHAHAMPDNIALFVLDTANRDDLLSVLEARLGPLH